mmetsp:Transcript_5594/g.8829  ORF Transcript_5594/g.8829 Transcript_5594/m.8829 type:complete len:103 (+) Transcript_5594:33-341(+)
MAHRTSPPTLLLLLAVAVLVAFAITFAVPQNKIGAGVVRGNFAATNVIRTCGPSVSRGLSAMAHKKGSGSTENGRDSQSKRLGLKVTHGKGAKIFRAVYHTH